MKILLTLFTLTVVILLLPLSTLGHVEMKRVQFGETVVLKCNVSLHHDIFWLKVNMKERPKLLIVARLKNNGGLTQIHKYNNSNVEGCFVEKLFGLKIVRVLKNDLGSYFCGILDGKRMEFENGVHLYEEVAAESKGEVTEKELFSYPIFAAVLGVGQVIMVLVVIIVHGIFWKKD